MAGGNKGITGKDGKQFSSTYQPKNRRKSTKFLTDLLTKELKGRNEVIVEGINPETGLKIKVIVNRPTKEQIVKALLQKAAKGDVFAIREVFDRVEGKTKQEVGLSGNLDFNKLDDSDLDTIVDGLLNKPI